MRRITCLIVAVAACVFAPRAVEAQQIGFFSPAGTGFDPEISVVNSGELLDAQAVVSDDRKYVTINARPSSSRLLALRDFSFARNGNNGPQLGFVGLAGGRDGNALDRRGTRLVGRL